MTSPPAGLRAMDSGSDADSLSALGGSKRSVLEGVHSTYAVDAKDGGAETIVAPSNSSDARASGVEEPRGMKRVPGGTFRMGSQSTGEEDERPEHEVKVHTYFLDTYEVTRAEYAECVAMAKCAAPTAKFAPFTSSQVERMFMRPRMPVVGVDWENARMYCEWNHKRLPTEAEFERAVRGDDGRKYPWGQNDPSEELTVYHRPLGVNGLEEVGSRPKGVGPYGHHDLAGNVWEWSQDLYDPYAYRRETASQGTPGSCNEIKAAQNELRKKGLQGFTGSNPIPTECERSIRGGAFNFDAYGLRSTNRVHHPAGFRLMMLGFRCAKSAEDNAASQ